MWLERYTKEEFVARYISRMEQIIRVMEVAEARRGIDSSHCNVLLSTRMREAWASERFWFNYGIRKSIDVDAVYWAALHGPGNEVLVEDLGKEMEAFVNVKRARLNAYYTDCRARFDE
jgi:hypothetical protein